MEASCWWTTMARAQFALDASTGDITLLNADCAEDFDLSECEDDNIEPGTVVVLDANGRIRSQASACNFQSGRCLVGSWRLPARVSFRPQEVEECSAARSAYGQSFL